MKFSPQQQRAINARGHHILVSASAGSGKTTVLTSRILSRVNDGINIDELLVVTFTEAAAAEMKDRLRHKLYEVIQTHQLDGVALTDTQYHHFERQLLYLSKMTIGTIDSFCNQLVKEYYYLLDDHLLDANPILLSDETEVMMLKEEARDQVRDRYLYGDKKIKQLTEEENKRRDDMMFFMQETDDALNEVLQLLDRIRALKDPFGYLNDLLAKTPKTAQSYLLQLKEGLAPIIKGLMQELSELNLLTLLEEIEAYKIATPENEWPNPVKKEIYQAFLEEDEGHLQAVLDAADCFLKADKEDALLATLTQLIEENDAWSLNHNANIFNTKTRKKLAIPLLDQWNNATKKGNPMREKLTAFLADILIDGKYDLTWLCQTNYRLATILVQVTKEVFATYQQLKLERQRIDFADLEHYAYALLQKEEVASFYQAKFKEIMIDEYQDVNQLQNAIMEAMSHHNLFMVGDVKQSIYGFRYADSDLFMEKYRAYKENPGPDENELIILAENYRSRQSILDYTNQIFLRLMDSRIGSIDYCDKEQLRCGLMTETGYGQGSYTEDDPAIEWFCYQEGATLDKEAKNELFNVIQDEKYAYLLMMASVIKNLVSSETLICDHGTQRPLTYQDIAILVSSRSDFNQMEMVFNACHIPIVFDKSQNYFKTTEVSQVLSYLMIIDNPHQDIPLVSVLRSPFVGLKEETLASIRLAQKEGSFYEALLTYQEENDCPNVQHFICLLEKYRDLCRKVSVSELIWQIYQDTHIDDYVAGLKNGAVRKKHLHALYFKAEQYEKNGHKGLYAFIQYMKYMQKKEFDVEAVTTNEQSDLGAVSAMTIHQSKGLEYPYVFFVDRTFANDTNQVLLDDEEGIVFKSLRDVFYKIANPQKRGAQYRAQKKEYAEKMRHLYVALTRAKEGLFIFQQGENKHDPVKEGLRLSEATRMQSTTYAMWMQDALSFGTVTKELDETYTYRPQLPNIEYCEYTVEEVYTRYQRLEEALKQSKESTLLVEENYAGKTKQAMRYLNQSYPYMEATETPNYASVSEIRTRLTEVDFATLTKEVTVHDDWAEPHFAKKEAVSAASIGTFCHLIMEKLPTDHYPSQDEIAEYIQKEVDAGHFSNSEASHLPIQAMQAFYQTEIGEKILKDTTIVYKEQPFSMVIDKEEDQILVHGIIDGYVIDGEVIELFDYKTNQRRSNETKASFIQRMVATYRMQMMQYKSALQASYPNKTIHASLYLLDIKEMVRIEENES